MYCQNCGKEVTGNFCSNCGAEVPKDEPKVAEQDNQQPETQATVSQIESASDSTQPFVPSQATQELLKDVNDVKPFYKKLWFWGVIFLVLIIIISKIFSNDSSDNKTASVNSKTDITQSSEKATTTSALPSITVADFSTMSKDDIKQWAETNKVKCLFIEEYSDAVASGNFISQSVSANDTIYEGDSIRIIYSKGKEPSIEYMNALKSAETYSDVMHMSKKAIYEQLISEYGDQFPADAAQYAIDNLQADYKANALETAKDYQQTMHMSKNAIYDQLISEYGEQFTKEEAQYAIDHLDD